MYLLIIKVAEESTSLSGSHSETVQHIRLKLTMHECLNRHCVRTICFIRICGGHQFICVDLTWNDPLAFEHNFLYIRSRILKHVTVPFLAT